MANEGIIQEIGGINIAGIPSHYWEGGVCVPQIQSRSPWTYPVFVSFQRGTLNYPDNCENHYLVRDNMEEFTRAKEENFQKRQAQRWGAKPPICEEKKEETRRSLVETFHNSNFLCGSFNIGGKQQRIAQHLALVCKAFAVGVRQVSNFYPFVGQTLAIRGEYHEAIIAKGNNNTIFTVHYKCICQLWKESVELRGYVD